MGFYNIFIEGQQVEEYKKKKEAKRELEEDKRRQRYESVDTPGARGKVTSSSDHVVWVEPTKDDKKRDHQSSKAAKRAIKGEKYDSKEEHQLQYNITKDAVNKHMRRHPEQWKNGHHIGPQSECGIFESVEFL